MNDDRKQAVQAQFRRQASWYTISEVHRQSEGLAELIRLAAPSPDARALDVATGTGFTALAVAPRCRRVVGLDLTLGMVTHAQRLAAERAVANLQFCLGDAEAIPFGGDVFDIVTCRLAAHHFPNLGRAFREMGRVARRGARVILDDTCTPDVPHLAALMNEWEVRRDPSHIANHPPSRLRAMLEECGLRVDAAVPTYVPQVFSDWVRRAGVAESTAASLRASFLGAGPDARSAFRIEPVTEDIHFVWPEIVILGVKP
jgi:ubiquinone/menaquinone biosynthesis C-methylase UbiE